jgi:subtilisin family serine protease
VIVDPVVTIGCAEAAASPTSASRAGTQSAAQKVDNAAIVRKTSTTPRYDPARLTVTWKRDATPRTIAAALAKAHVSVGVAIPQVRTDLLDVDPSRRADALASLRSSAGVASAGLEPLADALDTSPNDSDWPRQVGLRVAGFPKAWDITRGASRIVVAVVDTGVDPDQPDLRGALVPGYDFVNSDADPRDDEGHGTAVAGIIAARSDNRQGVTGVCWLCSIMPIKVLDATGTGDDTVIAAGIVWAVDHGAQVINLSLGGPATSPGLTAAVAYATSKGASVVAAAGNSGTTTPFYPAADPSAISVAATTPDDTAYPWSNFGQWVDVAAPGCNIAPVLSGGYGTFCGTSSATPVVSGLAALQRSAEPGAAPAVLRLALERSGLRLPDIVRNGRIDAAEALAQLGAAPAIPARATETFSGAVDALTRTRSYPVPAGGGLLAATLRFPGHARLSLALETNDRRALARVVGRSPLRLSTTVLAGTLRLVVRGDARVRFALTVSYVKPAA